MEKTKLWGDSAYRKPADVLVAHASERTMGPITHHGGVSKRGEYNSEFVTFGYCATLFTLSTSNVQQSVAYARESISVRSKDGVHEIEPTLLSGNRMHACGELIFDQASVLILHSLIKSKQPKPILLNLRLSVQDTMMPILGGC